MLSLIMFLMASTCGAFVKINNGRFSDNDKDITIFGVNLNMEDCTKDMFKAVSAWQFNAVRVEVKNVDQLPQLFKWAKKYDLYLHLTIDANIDINDLKPFIKRKELLAWEVETLPQAQKLNDLDENHLIAISVKHQNKPQNTLKQEEHAPIIDFITLNLLPIDFGWVAPTNLHFGLKHAFLNTTMLLNELGRMAKQLNKPMVVTSCAYPRNKMFRFEGSDTNNREAYFATVQSFMNQQSDSEVILAACFFSQWRLNDSEMTNEMPQPNASYSIYPSDNNFLNIAR